MNLVHIITYCSFSFVPLFGSLHKINILSPSLYPTSLFSLSIILFSVSIFFSYALQFYVLMEIVSPNVLRPMVSDRWFSATEYLARIIINLITCKLLYGKIDNFTLALTCMYLSSTLKYFSCLGSYRAMVGAGCRAFGCCKLALKYLYLFYFLFNDCNLNFFRWKCRH